MLDNDLFQTAILASGSKGNCLIIRTKKTKILLDAGLSGKRILNALSSLHLNENKIDALIISHEHRDHIKGAGIICRKLKIPLYISEQTYLVSRNILGKIPYRTHFFTNGKNFNIGDIIITPFSSSHDVVDGSNFIFQIESNIQRKLAVATDLGYSSRLTILKLKDSSTIILESNYDVKMLLEGSYPWNLKQRVKSREGHLSNEQAVGVISRVIHHGLKNLILAHLSEQNNTPEKAKLLMEEYLNSINYKLNLVIASQYETTSLIDI